MKQRLKYIYIYLYNWVNQNVFRKTSANISKCTHENEMREREKKLINQKMRESMFFSFFSRFSNPIWIKAEQKSHGWVGLRRRLTGLYIHIEFKDTTFCEVISRFKWLIHFKCVWRTIICTHTLQSNQKDFMELNFFNALCNMRYDRKSSIFTKRKYSDGDCNLMMRKKKLFYDKHL